MTRDRSELERACDAATQTAAAMSRVERAYEASIQRLARLKADVDGDQRPCRDCRYGCVSTYSFERVCRNPILRDGYYNRDTGKITWTHPKWDHHSGARSESGACGPIGLMFVPANPIVTAWRHTPVRLVATCIAALLAVVALVVIA